MDDAQRNLLAAQAAFDQQDAILRDSLPEIIKLKKRLQDQEELKPLDRRFIVAMIDVIINKILYQKLKSAVDPESM